MTKIPHPKCHHTPRRASDGARLPAPRAGAFAPTLGQPRRVARHMLRVDAANTRERDQMTRIPILTTERLTLRAPRAADLGIYLDFYAHDSAIPGKYRSPRPRAEAEAILLEDIDHWQRNGFGMWLLERRDDSAVVGGCGIVHPDDWPSHELTWWLLPRARGNGYATEASLAAIAFGYNTLGWPAVETHMRDENLPARRLAERLGGTFLRRGLFPDGVERDVFLLPHPEAPTPAKLAAR